jgi:predicted nucleotidyltransferase component of viral defense system
MPEQFLRLTAEERLEALGVASTASGRPIYLLEKDVWVVWTLQQLFESSDAEHLIFKGGTSLSKAYGVIERFSEDVDITYDIRAIAPDLVAKTADGFPETRSQQQKWTDEIRKRLNDWVADTMEPYLAERLAKIVSDGEVTADGDTIILQYPPVAMGTGYVAPTVRVEFGARSTGEPHEPRSIVCDAAEHLAELEFPSCKAHVMRAERTFWEKATAIHVFCLEKRLRGERFARHWYDVMQLDSRGFANRAMSDHALAEEVAKHKSIYFAAKAADGTQIDYSLAVNGSLVLVPEGEALQILEQDYVHMKDDGLLPAGAEEFQTIMARCADIEKRANAT